MLCNCIHCCTPVANLVRQQLTWLLAYADARADVTYACMRRPMPFHQTASHSHWPTSTFTPIIRHYRWVITLSRGGTLWAFALITLCVSRPVTAQPAVLTFSIITNKSLKTLMQAQFEGGVKTGQTCSNKIWKYATVFFSSKTRNVLQRWNGKGPTREYRVILNKEW